jgi:hypothetical protein
MGAMLAGVVLLAGLGTEAAIGRTRRIVTSLVYGASEIGKLWPRRQGELWRLLLQFVPYAFHGVSVNVIATALLGFTSTTATAGWTENTATSPRHAHFGEIGMFNVPCGPWNGPQPNPDPNAPDNSWGKHANGPLVRSMLGRGAVMGNNEWKSHHADQVAVGIADQVSNEAGVRSELPAYIQPSTRGWSPYRVGLMFASFSVGPTGTARRVLPYAEILMRAPERGRWKALRDAVVARSDQHAAQAVYAADCKLESARVVAQRAGDSEFLAWWAADRPLGNDVDTKLARLAGGRT